MDEWVTNVLIVITALLALVAVPEFVAGAILAVIVTEVLTYYLKIPKWLNSMVFIAIFLGTAVAIPIALDKQISGGSSDEAATSCYKGACN